MRGGQKDFLFSPKKLIKTWYTSIGMLQSTLLICWLIFIVYWFISSWFVKPTQKTVWGFTKIRWVILGIFAILFLLNKAGVLSILSCVGRWDTCKSALFVASLGIPYPIQILSVLFVIFGLVIAIIARRTLADNWSGMIELKKGHELITKGIYGYMRHPIYTGLLLMGFGTVLFFETPYLILTFVLMIVLLIIKLRKEEQLMTEYFPKEYPQYKRRVRALIPHIL